MTTPINELTDLGQSLWYDNIERRLIENGEIERMVREGDIRGLTSNPSIFNHTIANSSDYDTALVTMAWAGYTSETIFEQLALEDIQAVADILHPLYKETKGEDGYVSLEVNPHLAHDAVATLAEAHRLWKKVKRPNLMIKIPATKEGIVAIQQAIADGLNINITLIFSVSRYLEVINAYLSGLETRLSKNQEISNIASVASFFISRIDTKVDQILDAIIHEEGPEFEQAEQLLGKIAIANAKVAYKEFQKQFQSTRFKRLEKFGANIQRPLWASTSTKNPAYPDTLYVDELIGSHTVNTVPQQTLIAFKEHGRAQLSVGKNLGEARGFLKQLKRIGVSIDQVTQELEDEGVASFEKAYDNLLKTIDRRRNEAILQLGPLAEQVVDTVKNLEKEKVIQRINKHDPTLWSEEEKDQAEIQIRMGWLDLPESSLALLPELDSLNAEIQATRYTHALLLGMGGSSLAPEVMSLMFGPSMNRDGGGLDLAILDSTEPTQVLNAARRAPVESTLFIVSSKSGTTTEVNALFNYFWEKAENHLKDNAGKHFIAITDPGTPLEKLAKKYKFRKVFLADPNVGGRYSALTAFGLVPASLMGLNVRLLLDRASWMAEQCKPGSPAGRNPGLVLGAILGTAVKQGHDKLTFGSDPTLAPVGSWLEQLIAESSGKQETGIIPVDGETLESPNIYGRDRIFTYLRRSGMYDEIVQRLLDADFPTLSLNIMEDYDLGSEFYRWEYATAVACHVLGVNAFDQPNVQDSKTRTKSVIRKYKKYDEFGEKEPAWTYKGFKVYLSRAMGRKFLDETTNLQAVMEKLVSLGEPGDYIAINAYLPRDPGMEVLLARLQSAIRLQSKLATTLGFGPRFLHSTGQLHKGGPNEGIFLEITSDPVDDLEIPNEDLSFAVLVYGQALGDFEALNAKKRRVLRLHLPDHQSIHQVIEAFDW